ncbi:hypothetical protein [Lutimaribacter saemankumensis]|uniref:hypothetical protein n=1 Tax=Lutimaribacter saemankumensis TaxID=490829 RepID=UPI001587F6FB|nr:hypothetical protein [Lutimaribacter saemankumensis]
MDFVNLRFGLSFLVPTHLNDSQNGESPAAENHNQLGDALTATTTDWGTKGRE